MCLFLLAFAFGEICFLSSLIPVVDRQCLALVRQCRKKKNRPRVDALAKNRHFFAAEAIEAIFMQLFLLEVRKRTDTPSIIWLHDGLWIGREVDDQILYAAESHVRHLLFPHSNSASSLFSIVDLHEAWQSAVSTCPPPSPPVVCQMQSRDQTRLATEEGYSAISSCQIQS